MRDKIIGVLLAFTILLGLVSLGFKGEEKDSKVKKISTNDVYDYIAINQIFMWISNNGDGSHDPQTDAQGFFWPGGINAVKGAVFEDGFLWGGKIGREIRVGGSDYRHGLEAGPILADGNPANPGSDKYRIYKIRKGWENLPPGPEKDRLAKDYDEWPVDDGAPWVDVDGDGVYTKGVDQPQFIGDEVLWFVSNDLDPAKTTFLYGTLPLGLEMQCTVFGFKRTGALGDMVFKKYKLINKGNNTIKDMIVGYWSDTDLGDANDDYTGCDTALSLGYTYNGTNHDQIYGTPPPAIGYDFFQGPIVQGSATDSAKFLSSWRHGYRNLPMTAFTFYINSNSTYRDPTLGSPAGAIEMYNYMEGKLWDGTDFIDPNSGQAVKFVLAGDPVAGTGWYEGAGWPNSPTGGPGDRRHLMSSGPFTMTPGDTQEVVVGLVIAQGANNLNSITALKEKDAAAQIAYDLDFNLTPAPNVPKVIPVPGDKKITLTWETNAEKYHEVDPIIPDTIRLNVSGTDYVIPVGSNRYFNFQGYQVWQYKDLTGTDPVLLATFDKKDSVSDIRNYQYDYIKVNGGSLNQEPLISGPNEGLRRYYTITKDAYTNGPLYNGNPYYFAVTAYGYSKYSDPPILESSPQIVEVFPGTKAIDANYTYDEGSSVPLSQIAGVSDANIRLKVVDANALTGHKYKVAIYGPEDSLKYAVIDVTLGDTLLADQTDFGTDSLHKPVVDGFMALVEDTGADSLSALPTKYGVKGVYETKGPGGVDLSDPINVLKNYSSNGKWMIKAKGPNKTLIWQTVKSQEGFGYDDYEVRFSGTSRFYATGYAFSFTPVTKNDTLSPESLPFEIWDVGRTPADTSYRLMIKVLDFDRTDSTRAIPDNRWTQLPNGDWEELFAYHSTFDPANPPEMSGVSQVTAHKFGNFSIHGDVPEQGTVIKIEAWKPLKDGDEFEGVATAPNLNDTQVAQNNLNDISVFPNPYFGANSLERDKYQRFVRFTNLPNQVTIRIFSLSGVFIRKLDKSGPDQYLDWDLRNKDGLPIASGMYIAYLDMPGVGTKIMKLAVIMEQQYIDRL